MQICGLILLMKRFDRNNDCYQKQWLITLLNKIMILVGSVAFLIYSIYTKTCKYAMFIVALCSVVFFVDGIYYMFFSPTVELFALVGLRQKSKSILTKLLGVLLSLFGISLGVLFIVMQ